MRPPQNKPHFEKVKGFLEDAKRDGKIVAGGEVQSRKSYFIPPTIVRDIPDDARLVTEEQFGPIVPVLRYSDVADAIARANASDSFGSMSGGYATREARWVVATVQHGSITLLWFRREAA